MLIKYVDMLYIYVHDGYMLISKIELVNEGENTIPNTMTMRKEARILSAQYVTVIRRHLEDFSFGG